MLGIRNYNHKCIYDYKVSKKNAVEIKELKKGERASIVSNTMFTTMFQNKKRIKYSARLLSCILDISYDELLKNIRFYKNNSNKEYNTDKNQRCDYVVEIDGSYVNIEMNNNSSLETMERNIQYLNSIYSDNVKEGNPYSYNQTIQINLNNFSFEGKEEGVEVHGLLNEKKELLTKNIIYVQIYIPKIREKWYTKGKEVLNELERCILALTEPGIDVAKDISLGDSIMEDYVDESIEVCKKKSFGQSYDKERATMEEYKKDGIKEGISQTKIEIAKSLLSSNMPLEEISHHTGLSIEEIEKLK